MKRSPGSVAARCPSSRTSASTCTCGYGASIAWCPLSYQCGYRPVLTSSIPTERGFQPRTWCATRSAGTYSVIVPSRSTYQCPAAPVPASG